ncbi:FkbM family methyltransferase [Ruegeria lacuscaerulensis]|uniref:FkbM family methyltransferase n=1 Tax=Ruegeria lacuscaerulensis TaxID=55218 RepID=UPI00147E9AEC|nr:FkbM family methyltransferase [Ruegeria lacuscaerulensis]
MTNLPQNDPLPNRAGFSRCEYTPSSGLLLVSGWALGNLQSVELVTASGDSSFSVILRKSRTDVSSKFPEYEDPAPGWELQTIFFGELSDLMPVTVNVCFDGETLSFSREAVVQPGPSASYATLLSDNRYSEVSALLDFVASLHTYLSDDDYDACIAVCERNDFAIVEAPNFRKILLQKVFGDGPVRLLGREFTFANLNDAVMLIDEILLQDCYRYVPSQPDPLIVDLGASNGIFAASVLESFKDARVIAVEADPQNVELLKKNLSPYKSDRVHIIGGAVASGTSPNVELVVPQDYNIWGGLGASTQSRQRFDSRDLRTIEVPRIRLADLITEEVDFLKVDIEGAEYDTLIDDVACLSRVRRLAIEIHFDIPDAGNRLATLISQLTQSGFMLSFSGPPVGRIDENSIPSALLYGNRP